VLQDQVSECDSTPDCNPENPVLILYTSGTSGKPKGVVLSGQALRWSARNSVFMHSMTASDHILMVLPMFHAGGFNIQTLPALSVGASVSLQGGFEPGAVLAEISDGQASLTGLVPAQITALTSHPNWWRTNVSHLRIVTTGSTHVPESCIDAWVDRDVTALKVYGATETCAVAIHQTQENMESSRGSVGKAARHSRIKVVDNDGREASVGAPGEILVKGPSVFKEYWRQPEKTSAALVKGWFHSGDIGVRREDGSFVIADRKVDMIISGGENIYPAELEVILNEHPEIEEAAVIGRADEKWGEVPVAYVAISAHSELDERHVLALFQGRLARFKHPRKVVIVGQLPRNAMGKILRYKLRDDVLTRKES